MIANLWKRFKIKMRRPSPETVQAERRLAAVRRDNTRVNITARESQRICRTNHLGPLIAQLFERKQ